MRVSDSGTSYPRGALGGLVNVVVLETGDELLQALRASLEELERTDSLSVELGHLGGIPVLLTGNNALSSRTAIMGCKYRELCFHTLYLGSSLAYE